MTVTLREATHRDVASCAEAMYISFMNIDKQHGFPSYFSDLNHAREATRNLIANPHTFGLVTTANDRVIASAFMNEKRPIRAIGPVSVHPKYQGRGIGRKMMNHLLERTQDAPSVRLTQDAFNTTSLSLYTSLGFALVESLVWVEGKFRNLPQNPPIIHPIQEENRAQCLTLCQKITGFERLPDNLIDTYGLIQNQQVTAYTAALSVDGYAFAKSKKDMQSLMLGMASKSPSTLSCLIPTRYNHLLLWCLSEGFKIKKPLNLMVRGTYQPPDGIYFPSLLY